MGAAFIATDLTGVAFFTATGAAFLTAAGGGFVLTARVAERDEDTRSSDAGAKAAAPAMRVENTAIFIVVRESVNGRDGGLLKIIQGSRLS
jgi:hypothetical protein